MLTADEIARAKTSVRYSLPEGHHEHDDCIRIAHEWLDAQKKLKSPRKTGARPLKHLIEKWGGRYVSQTDVEVAAHLHADVVGTYPYYNISSRLTEPAQDRLQGIGEAHSQGYHDRHEAKSYANREDSLP